jgi:hypothetical protein
MNMLLGSKALLGCPSDEDLSIVTAWFLVFKL